MKSRYAELFCDVLPCHLYRHVALHLIGITGDYVGEYAWPFLQPHDRNHVWEITFKGRMEGLVIDNERENSPSNSLSPPPLSLKAISALSWAGIPIFPSQQHQSFTTFLFSPFQYLSLKAVL